MRELSKDELKDYTLGYNQGYRFAEALPSVSSKMFSSISDGLKDKPRMQGMMDGIKQMRKERFVEKQQSKAPKKSILPNKDKPTPSMDR